MADGAQVYADLMRTARVNGHLQEREHPQLFGADDPRDRFTAPARPCRFPAAGAALKAPGGHLLPIRRVAADRRVDASSRLYLAPHQREIFFFDLPVVKLARQLFVRLVVLGHHHQAGCTAVEAVHDPRSPFSPDAAQIIDVMKERVDQRSARVSGRGMDHHPGRFVDDDDVFVLVEDGQRQCFRLRHRIDRLGDVDADSLSSLHRLIRLRLAAGDLNQAFLDQALNLRP